jgi:hypothetical protein
MPQMLFKPRINAPEDFCHVDLATFSAAHVGDGFPVKANVLPRFFHTAMPALRISRVSAAPVKRDYRTLVEETGGIVLHAVYYPPKPL